MREARDAIFFVTILLTLYKVAIDKPNREVCETKDRSEGMNMKRRKRRI